MKFIREKKLRAQPQLRRMQDLLFVLESFTAADKIVYYPIKFYTYIINSEAITRKMNFKMLDYCFRVHEAAEKWRKDNSIAEDINKYFAFALFFDMLDLTYLHQDCKEGFFVKFKAVSQQYDRFSLSKSLRLIRLRDLLSSLRRGSSIRILPFKLFGKYPGILSQFILVKLKRLLRP